MGSKRFQTCGKYDGTEDAGCWLRNLSYDLEEANLEEIPKVFFQPIDLKFVKELPKWLDSTLRFRRFTEQADVSTAEDVKDFKRTFVARFSQFHGFESSEESIQEDTNKFSHGPKEPLLDYYGRAQKLLRQSHARDAPVTGGEALNPIERMVVNGVIEAFLRGIHDDNLKKTILVKADKLPASLLEAHEYAQQAMRRLEQLKEFETREYEKLEVEYLRRNYAEKNTRPLRSVLAKMY
ncbi:hypothetical protein K3495_g15293 [Podosphaera aphanis]|nr:hypothetical protein K3495_g15293 [Podosphaera aphanis]